MVSHKKKKKTCIRRCSVHAARAQPEQQRGRQLWTASQSPAVDWSSFQRVEGGLGSLPFPLHTADVCYKIMGGITSPPAVLVHRASQTDRKTRISQARPPSCSSGGHRARAAAGDPTLPSSGYWTFSQWVHCGSCDTRVAQLYLLHQPLISTFLWPSLYVFLSWVKHWQRL